MDVLHLGHWESGVVEAINPSRTSVEVSLFNDGNRHWFDITMGQVALFSTRAGVMDGDLDGMPPLVSQEDIFGITDTNHGTAVGNSANNGSGGGSVTSPAVVYAHMDDVYDVRFKNQLQVGTLVDVLSLNNHWVVVSNIYIYIYVLYMYICVLYMLIGCMYIGMCNGGTCAGCSRQHYQYTHGYH